MLQSLLFQAVRPSGVYHRLTLRLSEPCPDMTSLFLKSPLGGRKASGANTVPSSQMGKPRDTHPQPVCWQAALQSQGPDSWPCKFSCLEGEKSWIGLEAAVFTKCSKDCGPSGIPHSLLQGPASRELAVNSECEKGLRRPIWCGWIPES